MVDAVEKPAIIRPPLIWVAELFSVLTAAGFLASIWMHQTVFSGWGLSYFQIATPSDVLMGGISTAAVAIGLAPWVLAGAVTGGAVYWLAGLLAPARRWLDWLVGLAVLLTVFGVVREGITASADAAGIVMLAYGAAAAWLLLRIKPRLSPTGYHRAALGVLAVGLAVALGYACGQRITFGFGGDHEFASTLAAPYDLRPQCERERVVWIGQRSMVVRCSGKTTKPGDTSWDEREIHLVLLNPGPLWLGDEEQLRAYARDRRAYDMRPRPTPPTTPAPTPSMTPE